MSTMPDIGALALVPHTVSSTTKPKSEVASFETLPVEIRVKIFKLLFVTIDILQVTWIEESEDAPPQRVIRRKVRPVNPLAIKAVSKKIEEEVILALIFCPIHIEVYGYHYPGGWQPDTLNLCPWAQAQVEKVVMNVPLWGLDEPLAFMDRAVYRDVRLLQLTHRCGYGPIPSDLITAHLAAGNRTFKLDREITNEFLEFLDPEPALLDRIKSGRLTVQARYEFHERRVHATMGHGYDALIAKGVLELNCRGIWVLELKAAETKPRHHHDENAALKQQWEDDEKRF